MTAATKRDRKQREDSSNKEQNVAYQLPSNASSGMHERVFELCSRFDEAPWELYLFEEQIMVDIVIKCTLRMLHLTHQTYDKREKAAKR